MQFKGAASTSYSLEVAAQGQKGTLEIPDRDICVSRSCKELCSSGYVLSQVDFPELAPFLGYVVKEKCSLNQMDDNHSTILECPVSLIDFTPKNTGVPRSLLFCSPTNYRNKTNHHDQRSTSGSSYLKKMNFSLNIRLKIKS